MSVRADIAKHELIAVWCGSCDAGAARHSTCAAHVFNDNLLAEDFRESRRKDPSQNIDSAARAKWDHHGYWSGGPILRRRGPRTDDSECKAECRGAG